MSGTFHAGELALQERAGSRERLAEVGPRVIRDHMPAQHREFFELLPFLLVGSRDAQGQPWASALAGPPGFVHSPDPRRLRIEALPLPHDPLAQSLREGAPLGLLGIQTHTRRRNRMNGTVSALDAQGFDVTVGQSFGNCPKYIEPRELRHAPRTAGEVSRTSGLDERARRIIAGADTFFIATAHPGAGTAAAFGVDVSHRGGPAGFVRGQGERLSVPDFLGNAFFNTLGNLHLDPRCGLLFIDWADGSVLQLAARGRLEWTPAGERTLHMDVVAAVHAAGALSVAPA